MNPLACRRSTAAHCFTEMTRLLVLLPLLVSAGCESGPSVDLPNEAEALSIFEDLHRGIYRAFDSTEPGAIYDSLADSVAGDLLDQIYLEVHESLIAREHGGVVSKIVSVDTVALELVEPPRDGEDGPGFRVRATWEVSSVARHEQHTHVRNNQYEALYRVAFTDPGWRIVADRMLRQRRVGDEWIPTAGSAVGGAS